MRKFLMFVLVAIFASVIFFSCNKVSITMEPEVEIIWFDPLGWYVVPGDNIVEIDEIHFKVWNYVDSRIKQMDVEFRSIRTGEVVTTGLSWGLDILLNGGDDNCPDGCITKVYNVFIPVKDPVDYMFANDDNTIAFLTFSGEDAYGDEKQFSVSMQYSIIMLSDTTDTTSAFEPRVISNK